MKNINLLIGVVVLLCSCAIVQTSTFPTHYGTAQPRDRQISLLQPGKIDYWSDVKPILDKRCVVCHGCYDAPCQTKLTAPEAISRGANTSSPYDTERLFDAQPTRLFEDAQSDTQWRQLGFHAVLNEYESSVEANQQASPFYRLLTMKESVPTASNNQRLSAEEFSLEIYRDSVCPTAQTMSSFEKEHPNWGMPYALPILPEKEQKLLKQWVSEGAKYQPRERLNPAVIENIKDWESFFNRSSTKSRLVNRYLFEHLFLAHLYFSELSDQQFFRLVRSTTPPGQPVDVIATRRPFDAPGHDSFYYRLIPEKESIVFKTHLPYALNAARMDRWQQLFHNNTYEVKTLPDYSSDSSANPFKTFKQIPAQSRYRFLLDEAQFTIMNYIKGSVCRGSVALNVIRDQFWVFFVDPEAIEPELLANYLDDNTDNLAMPSVRTSLTNMPANWVRYSRKERRFLEGRDRFLQTTFSKPNAINLDLVWDGDGVNDNAALTIFRHYDRATIEKGLIGHIPETAWLIDYPLLERIHYLLVAGYDVYGNMSHQILTRLHMDFLRIEGESNFLMLLPRDTRKTLRSRWYRDATEDMVDFVNNSAFENFSEPGIDYRTANHKKELVEKLQIHLDNVLETRRSLDLLPVDVKQSLIRLASFEGTGAQALPEITYLRIDHPESKPSYYTLLRNNAQTNLSSIANEDRRIIPEETTVTVTAGIVGAYPTALMKIAQDELPQFVNRVLDLTSTDDFSVLMNDFGIRRTHPDFWKLSDELQQFIHESNSTEAGIIDYIRLGNF